MQTQPNHARCIFDRKPKNISEIRVERHENSPLLNRKGPNSCVLGAAEVNFYDRKRIVTLIAQIFGVQRRKVFVKEEFHASARITSSPASAAA